MRRPKHACQGITLIELIVVIFLILVLAWLIVPILGPGINTLPAQPIALNKAKQIASACKLFAADHEGRFPSNALDAQGKETNTPPSSSNAALSLLVPDYIPDKKCFWLDQDSAYCNSSVPDPSVPGLSAGENHWGYVVHLTEKSDQRFPLLADGAIYGGITYSVDQSSAGGTWKGKKAIVVYVDGSGAIEPIDKKTLAVPGPTLEIPNLLQSGQKDWLGADNKFLNPMLKPSK